MEKNVLMDLKIFYLKSATCRLIWFAGDNIGLADFIGETLQNQPAISSFLNECCK